MTKDEALKMAYKAEETGNLQDLIDAVNALMEALEQKGFDAGINVGNKEKSSNNPNEVGLEQPNNERKSIMQPTYYEKTIAGEYVKASPQPVRIEQPEIKLADGITVEEWHELREPKEQPAFGECGNKSCGGHGACYCEEQPVMAISQMNNDALKNALNNQGKLSVSSPQPQPAQEPVAWMGFNANGNAEFLRFNELNVFTTNQTTILQKPIPLYTHPHQWQGLTDDEILKLKSMSDLGNWFTFALAIEQALKEKNGL